MIFKVLFNQHILWFCDNIISAVSEPQQYKKEFRQHLESPVLPKLQRYIIAQLFDTERPTTFLQFTLALISCLDLDQYIEVKLQGH